MNNKKEFGRPTDFDSYLAEQLKNKKFKKYFDEFGQQLELSYKIMQLRKAKKMSQAQLAKKVGTTQSNIARFEGGRENFTIGFLSKLVLGLGAELKIEVGK
jgi:ribosome-binding protein aMBF1 (putative translation factor)